MLLAVQVILNQSINQSMKKCFILHADGRPKYIATSMKADFKEEPNVSILTCIHQLSSHTMPDSDYNAVSPNNIIL